MTISLTFTGETPDDIQRQVVAWAGTPIVVTGTPEKKTKKVAVDAPVLTPEQMSEAVLLSVPDEGVTVVPLEDAVTSGGNEPTDTSTTSDPAGTAEPPSDAVPEYPVVREKVLLLAVAKGAETVRDLLSSKYGVAKASDLDPSRWNALLADVALVMG